MITNNFDTLKNHVPSASLPILQKWFTQRPFELKLSKKRTTKFGDFRIDSRKKIPRISVNSNLNEFAFLITLTHEFAHLLVWLEHQHRVKAHGAEWKTEFQNLMRVLLQKEIFPESIALALKNHMKNPPASSARDANLIKELKKFDPPSGAIHLDELPEGAIFTVNYKRSFIKGEKRRTRFFCTDTKSNRVYLIHGIAEVHPL